VGFVVDKVALGQVFSEFPLPIFIPPISPQSPSPIIRGWYNRTVSGRSTQSPTPLIKKKLQYANQDSPASKTVDYELEYWGSISGKDRDFLNVSFCHPLAVGIRI
jgi:hypothetical protein